MEKILYLVIPCYNEEAVLHETEKQLTEKVKKMMETSLISRESKIVFVNDGSKDKTWNIITKLHEQNSMVQGINLSRNRGHQNAVLAGLMTVKEEADMVISLDADLQDDIEVLSDFVQAYYDGADVVYGVRNSRETDTFFKRNTALAFYKLMQSMGVDIVYNHADYRLMSKRVLTELENFKEVNLFLRGLMPLIGFKSATVTYDRHERFAGESKYPLKKMLAFAIDGITSFSIKPIRLVTITGLTVFTISLLMLVYSLVRHFMGATEIGWTSLIVSIWAIGGLQLLGIGIVGEYIGKIYLETKARPKFIIEEWLK